MTNVTDNTATHTPKTVADLREAILALNPESTGLDKLKKPELVAVWEQLSAAADEEQLTAAQAMSRKLREARQRYVTTTSASGNASADNDDIVAQSLRAMEPRQVVAAAERILGLAEGELWAKYEKLNPGQQRMNAGNRIRGAIKRGDVVVEEVLSNLH